MTKTVRIVPSGRTFVVQGNETLLEAALACGLRLDYGCSNGHCGRYRARVVGGSVVRVRHSDFPFRAAERQAGHILLCTGTATSDPTPIPMTDPKPSRSAYEPDTSQNMS